MESKSVETGGLCCQWTSLGEMAPQHMTHLYICKLAPIDYSVCIVLADWSGVMCPSPRITVDWLVCRPTGEPGLQSGPGGLTWPGLASPAPDWLISNIHLNTHINTHHQPNIWEPQVESGRHLGPTTETSASCLLAASKLLLFIFLVKPSLPLPDISFKMSAPSSLSLMNLRAGKKIKVLVIILTNNAAFDRGN